MRTFGWIIGAAVAVLALIFVFGYLLGEPENGLDNIDNGENGAATTTEDVVVESPDEGSIISSPLTVTGEARGTWFFEANLPVVLLDGAGNMIAQVGAQAQDEWMTTDFVPFSATLNFTAPTTTATGTLVIMKDNPSGLPENDDEVRIPIRFR